MRINPENLRIGLKVYWNDPDNDLCSGPGTIAEIIGDEMFPEDMIIVVFKDDGGVVECPVSELSKYGK